MNADAGMYRTAAMTGSKNAWKIRNEPIAIPSGIANTAESRKLLNQLQALVARPGAPYVPSLYVASVYTGMGNLDEAFRYLDKAADERCEYLIYLEREPMADALRSDPRFETLLTSNGLKPPAPK